MSFQDRYATLNAKQKQAVDTIEGPVMVVAGPGTGKTELLGMRAANILRKTDTLPSSILCLTFTDSGAVAMRERLASIIGKDAYKVAIHTFHSFGSEVINQYGEYFYQGALFRPADELASHEIIREILDELDYTNPLTSKMNGEYTYIRDILTAISHLKRSGLTSDELLQILDNNDAILDAVERSLAEIFARRISSTTLAQLVPITRTVAELDIPNLPGDMTPLADVLSLSLAHAIDEATTANSTKPITAWKNRWLTKDDHGDFVFKDRARHAKLRALSHVYFQYLAHMQEAELYDYDDMILRVVHALEVFSDLRYNLQEKYQYIMVDEFQDTNLAQMRILASLTNNPVQSDTPNIMVVGDDDQAIYSFQGADISNILSFRTHYPRAVLIPLVDNYRSRSGVLATARDIITQGDDRLETYIDELDKTLTPHRDGVATVALHELATASDERAWLVESIAAQLQQGTKPADIAVLARRHHEIVALLPYFASAGIPVSYERRDNVFELPPVQLLLQTARVVTLLAQQAFDEANGLLPELLAHPAWGISTDTLWKLSIKAYDGRSRWLDIMPAIPELAPLAQWFQALAREAQVASLETTLDTVLGTPGSQAADSEADDSEPTETTESTTAYASPLYGYFFSAEALATRPDAYISYLEGLRTIRGALRDYHPEVTPTLAHFVGFAELYQSVGGSLTSVHKPLASNSGAIHLMTAHKSKGLEFDTVYVVGAIESAWGERVRGKSNLISFPENLPLAPAGDSPSERLRLFFVAVTRAKHHLHMSYSLAADNGKSTERAGFLLHLEATAETPHAETNETTQAERRWYDRLAAPSPSLETLLAPTLQQYKLSATHLGNFLDVTRGGPHGFLINNLLRFPQAMTPAAAYGSAIHETLQRAHTHLTAHKKPRAIEDILHDFQTHLQTHRLSAADLELYTQKGIDSLQAFLTAKYDSFTPGQKVELNFAGQQSIVGEAHLTGKLDLVDISPEDRQMVVTDYKTGHPARSWQGKTDYEKIKLHRYRQQLMFYKLLVEHSRDYGNYTVERGVLQFVEPTMQGDVLSLDATFTSEELAEFTELLNVVWRHITTLDLPNTDDFEPNYKGIVAFERALLDNKV